MRKHRSKILVIALTAALGLMAFNATSVLAVNLEVGDKFYTGEKGEFLKSSGTLHPTSLTLLLLRKLLVGFFKLLIPGKSSEIVCTSGELSSGSVGNEYENFLTSTMEVGGHGSGTILFKGCKTEEITAGGALTGKTLTNCVPNPATTPGEVTANVLALVKKHEGVTYLLFVPKVTSKATAEANEALTSAFTTMKFGELCALPPTVNFTGSLATKAPIADAIKPKLALDSFSAAGKAEQALLGAKLKFGANEGFAQGEVEAELPNNAGAPWGAM
jgi:hypothetical protein